MPKFHVICNRVTRQRVVLEVQAKSAAHARQKVEDHDDPDAEFEEEGFDEGTSDLTVESVRPVETPG